jgi:hypothetical protein
MKYVLLHSKESRYKPVIIMYMVTLFLICINLGDKMNTNYGYYEAAGRDTGITSILPESSSICNTGTDTGKYSYPSIFQNFQIKSPYTFLSVCL